MTWAYRGYRGYRGLHGGNKGLQEVTMGYTGL